MVVVAMVLKWTVTKVYPSKFDLINGDWPRLIGVLRGYKHESTAGGYVRRIISIFLCGN